MSKHVLEALFVLLLAAGQKAAIYSLSPVDAQRGRNLFARQQQAEQEFETWKTSIEQQFACGGLLEFTPTFDEAEPQGGGSGACGEPQAAGDAPVKGERCSPSSPAIGTKLGAAAGRSVVWACVSGVWALR